MGRWSWLTERSPVPGWERLAWWGAVVGLALFCTGGNAIHIGESVLAHGGP